LLALVNCHSGNGLANLPAVTPQQAAAVARTVPATVFYVEIHPADNPTPAMLALIRNTWHAGGIRIDYVFGNEKFYDGLVAAARTLGLKLDLITPYGQPSMNAAAYAKAAGVAAARYAGLGIVWEIYNEPNILLAPSLGTGLAGYVALAKATALAIRANDPSATIITGGTGGADNTDFTYAIAAGKALAPYVDGVSIHPYGIDYGSFGAAVVEVHAATGLNVYISEWGMNDQTGLTQAMQSAKGLTPMFCAYEYQEQPAETAAGDPNWSLVGGAWQAFAAGTQ
jgi:hypothetical protein